VRPTLLLALVLAAGCADPPAPGAWTDEALLAEGERYLADDAFRREALLGSLTNPRNVYARERVASYGLGDTGWDALPAWNPRSAPVTADVAAAIVEGAPVEAYAPVWDGETPTTMDGWVALGRRVFFRYPLRTDPYVRYAVRHPEADFGVARDADGAVVGAVAFRDADGDPSVGLTCALCHTDVRGGAVVVGAARRGFDYGALRLAYHDATGVAVDEDLARRMAEWGPGRADITADTSEDPVAIPDLWGLRYQTTLTQAGTILHTGPAALAIRQETQYLHANDQRTRPPRELTFALAMFLYSLEAPPAPPRDAAAERGARHFAMHCASCHDNEVHGGGLIPSVQIGTDPELAHGEARGTGHYRVPALVAVRDAAPYLHDGTVASLEDLLSLARFEDDYAGPRGVGAVPGHRYGMDLTDAERADLIALLQTL